MLLHNATQLKRVRTRTQQNDQFIITLRGKTVRNTTHEPTVYNLLTAQLICIVLKYLRGLKPKA